MKPSKKTEAETETSHQSEMELPIWAVVSFDRVEGNGLTHSEALRLLEELEARSIAGLCLVTDEAALRFR